MAKVSMDGISREFSLTGKQTIFNALRKQGEELPHGCLAGSCGACRVIITKGEEYLEEPGVMEAATLKGLAVNYERIFGKGSSEGLVMRLTCSTRLKPDTLENAEIFMKESN